MKTATRPSYRPFDAVVIGVTRLSESFVRITFGGDDLKSFKPEGVDQRLKVVLPNTHGDYPDFSDTGDGWYTAWCGLPDTVRPPMRTYTVRNSRRSAAALELDIDFVMHGSVHIESEFAPVDDVPASTVTIEKAQGQHKHSGPASRWLLTVATGDRVKLIGPDAESDGPWGGIAWNPPASATDYVLAGDETAAPAIAAVLESLPNGTNTRAFIEVPLPGDILAIDLPAGVEVTWLPRGSRPHGELLSAAVLAAIPVSAASDDRVDAASANGSVIAAETEIETIWDVPGLDPLTGARLDAPPVATIYAWLAGESSVIKALRRHLVSEVGIDRTSVAFMGYWKDGSAES